MTVLKIGTRRSNLALWQANHIADRLKKAHPGLTVEIVKIQTLGDQRTDVPLSQVGGKGLFVKEIEEALFRKEIDLAVHSLKDVPGTLPDGLVLSCIPEREDPRDALISREALRLKDLPKGGLLGTSSLRRGAQARLVRPDLKAVSLRGNVETRIRRLENGDYDAILLAYSGLKRLGLNDKVTEIVAIDVLVPAVGQGALAIETRTDDAATRERLVPLNHLDTADCVGAERGFLIEAEGNCQIPLAAHAQLEGDEIAITGLFAAPDGSRVVRGGDRGPRAEGEAIGRRLAKRLLEQGGREILDQCLAGGH